MIRTFGTTLRCESCVAKIKPIFDAEPSVHHWSVDTNAPEKPITVHGENVSSDLVNRLLEKAGYRVTREITTTPPVEPSAEPAEKQSYFPLLLILAYLLGVVGIVEYANGSFNWERSMRHFMSGFFLVFSFFKLLNVTAFADAYMTYDVVAKRLRAYGFIYPFIELGLGIAYLANFNPLVINLVTLVVMGVSSIGVIESLLNKRKIRCACLGTVFNLPMSVVTLVEDALMVLMAAAMLLMGTNHLGY
ncbi:MAG: copper chaperone [Planctomycetia bacterium]|nr:copper chaperone [Planctomycetia bacterium]